MTPREKYEALCKLGLSKSETARQLGVSVQAVDNAAMRYGLTFVNGNTKRKGHVRHDRKTVGMDERDTSGPGDSGDAGDGSRMDQA